MSAAEHATDHWDHKDEWRKHGRDFLVTITRHNEPANRDSGPHRWCVYAYIYPKHPHFAKFDGRSLFQAAAAEMPFHAYASLIEYPMYEGKVTSVKVGADYNHLHDNEFTHYTFKEDANEVFSDAERLFSWLQSRNPKEDAA